VYANESFVTPRYLKVTKRLLEMTPSRRCARLRGNEETEEHLMREIVIDTETTGLDPLNGDRCVKVGRQH
jgi:DNA polymerase III epsilon subunit-like protein